MSYTITENEPASHRDDLLSLWERNFPQRETAQRFDWLYRTGVANTWFAETQAGTRIGSTGLMKRRFRIGGQLCQAGQALDMNVDVEHRSIGPALQLQRQVVKVVSETDLAFAYGIPVPQAEVVMRRVGYRLLGSIERWTKPLRSEYKIRSRLKSPTVARMASAVVDVVLKYKSADAYYSRPAGVRTEIVSSFDERCDLLWEQALHQFSIVGERDAAYQNWRLRDCPDVHYRVFCLLEPASEQLLGYAVFCDSEGSVFIADLMFANDTACDRLLCEFIRFARSERRDTITLKYFGNRQLTDRLIRFGFSRRESLQNLMLYSGPAGPAPASVDLMDRQNWYITAADGDTDG